MRRYQSRVHTLEDNSAKQDSSSEKQNTPVEKKQPFSSKGYVLGSGSNVQENPSTSTQGNVLLNQRMTERILTQELAKNSEVNKELNKKLDEKIKQCEELSSEIENKNRYIQQLTNELKLAKENSERNTLNRSVRETKEQIQKLIVKMNILRTVIRDLHESCSIESQNDYTNDGENSENTFGGMCIDIYSNNNTTASQQNTTPEPNVDSLTLHDINSGADEEIDSDSYIDVVVKRRDDGTIEESEERYKNSYMFQKKVFNTDGCVELDIHEQDDTIVLRVYSNQCVCYEATYKVDWNNRNRIIRHGHATRYINGVKVEQTNYYSGKKVGLCKRWTAEGDIIHIFDYGTTDWDDAYWSNRDIIHNDINNIHQASDNHDGDIEKIRLHENGMDIVKFINKKGEVILEKRRRVDTGIEVYTYELSESNHDYFTVTYRDNNTGHITYVGSFKYVYRNGIKLKCKCGRQSAWFPNGCRRYEADYDMGKRVGWFHIWNEENILIARKKY
ncbi:hypothetical protein YASMINEVIRUS_146 [Yasminevirus sp. GU-2018]|uniref:Uncharacterized protein n=1 Tax=Yasminevirus sp. GU-2018 TaxID=2420051 RepID=A0A5K0U8L6_9VIRU|nr:hypothetical protein YASMINEVIRUS_146 [Yasminevirus sp. GU-2018]